MVFRIGFVLTFLLVEGHYQFVAARKRRQRAQARRSWFLHKSGTRTLCSSQLQRVFGILYHHHSRDHSFLKADRFCHGAVRCGLEMPCMLAHEQGQNREVRKVRHQVDARIRCDVRPTEATQSPEEKFLELRRQTCQPRWRAWGASQWQDPQQGVNTAWNKQRSKTPKKRTTSRKKGKAETYGAPELEPRGRPTIQVDHRQAQEEKSPSATLSW